MPKNNIKTIVAIILAFFFGFALHFSNPVIALLVMALLFLLAFFSFVVLSIGLFSKKFRVWYIIGFIPLLVTYTFETGIRHYKHKKAVAITTRLELFKKETGRYPKDLQQIKNDIEINGLKYSPDSSLTNYNLEYLMDAFNREYFSTWSGNWGTLGWND